MLKFLENKKIVIPIILIAGMLLFIVFRLATRDVYEVPAVTYAGDLPAEDTAPPELIGVHVTGAVNEPGFYEIPRGSRVNDLIRYAGGAAEGAFLDGINLAEFVFDQQQIHVPTAGEVVPGNPTQRRINLNTATMSELQTLPGIGPVAAQNIIELRQQMGGFRRAEDIMNVRGISAGRFEAMRDLIVVP